MTRYRYLLRSEAVYIPGFCDDTQDLSTSRGSGLALLEGPRLIEALLNESAPEAPEPGDAPTVTAITPGASIGLCELAITASNALDAERKVASWRASLVAALARAPATTDTNYEARCAIQHATFVVDVVPLDESAMQGSEAIASATAANRWRQLRQGSLRWPEPPVSTMATPCELDGVRPANVQDRGPDGSSRVLSRATAERRAFGRGERTGLYASVSDFTTTRRFSNSFEELTENEPSPRLAGKMAVIYADGNGIGSLVSPLTSVEQRRAFDESFRRQQGEMLAAYLRSLEAKLGESQDTLPIETLLWGGDEAIWVVPAWHAWDFLSNLLSHPFVMQVPAAALGSERCVRLSFAVGLVFCSHKAPIRRIKSLARDLAELAKVRGKRVGQPDAEVVGQAEYEHHASYVAYEVLESFDHLGMPVEEYRGRRSDVVGVDADQLLLPGAAFAENIRTLAQLRFALSGNLIKSEGRIRTRPTGGNEAITPGRAALQAFAAAHEDMRPAVTRVQELFGSALWSHLIDLRDYLATVNPEGS